MHISARSDYALRALLTLAAEGHPLTAEELAQRQELPVRFLEAIMIDLRKAGIVSSRRGRDAGYRFARDPDDCTPADVMRALEGPLAEVRGLRPEATDYKDAAASLQLLWIALRANLRATLEGVTIGQLARGELPVLLQDLVSDPDAWLPR